jgi:hypothetical protein
MSGSACDSYIASIDPGFVPAVLALDSAVMVVRADFDTRVFYRMLTYALNGDFRHWICAIDAHKKPFHLRFLYGVLFDDPRGVLRAGTGILRTIDFASRADIDAQLVTDYVSEAVSRLDEFKAQVRNR